MDTPELFNELSSKFSTIFSKEWYLGLLRKSVELQHKFSPRNMLFIFLQNPKATDVRSFMEWTSIGENVRRNERGLYIISPYTVETQLPPYTQMTTQIKFKSTNVFDISQTTSAITSCEFNPQLILDEKAFFEALCEVFCCKVSFQRVFDNSHGYFLEKGNSYVLNMTLNDQQLISVLLHLAIENQLKKTEQKKFIVESILYMLCYKFKLFYSENYFQYFDDFKSEITFENFQNTWLAVFELSSESIDKICEKINLPEQPKSDTNQTLSQKIENAKLVQTQKIAKESTPYVNFFQ